MRRGRYAPPATLKLGLSAWRCASRNGNGVALSRRRYRSRTISGIAANNTIINNKQGDTKTQKAVVTAVGFAWVCLSVTPVGKRVFLLIVPTIPTVMHGMTTAVTTVKNAPLGRSKSPPLAVQKQQLVDDPPNSPKGREFIESPSLALPKGREFILAAFVEVVFALLFLVKARLGVPLAGS